MTLIRSFTILAFVLLTASSPHAFGLGGDLDRPSLSFPAGFENDQAIRDVVCDQHLKFVGGSFVNAHSTLKYAGDADSLNAFLARLAACKSAKVTVSFSASDSDSAWTLDHDGWTDAGLFRVLVNTRQIAEVAVKVPNA